MANQQSLTVAGAECRLYVNNRVYSVTQSVSVTVDNGVVSTYGINSPYAQEISIGAGQYSAKGNVTGIRTKNSGGLQGANLLPLFSDLSSGNYISIRLESRSTGETIWSVPNAQVNQVTEAVTNKGIATANFTFTGQILYWTLDLS